MKIENMTKQEKLIDIATQSIASRLTDPDSLQSKVINMDVVYGSVGITFLDKDGSLFIEVYEFDPNEDSIRYRNDVMDPSLRF